MVNMNIKELTIIDKAMVVLLMFVLMVTLYTGVSFAFWHKEVKTEKHNTITTGCFSYTLDDINNINLDNTYPMTEEEALLKTPYTFTVTNTCSIDMDYTVTLNTAQNNAIDNYLNVALYQGDQRISKNILNTLGKYEDFNNLAYEDENGSFNIINSYILTNGSLSAATMSSDNSTVIAAGESKSYKLYLWLDESLEDPSTMGLSFEAKLIVTSTVAKVKPKCKRATTLHTETCSQTSTSNYCGADGYTQGSTITYGNLGSGSTLATGDAFTCDVNGDGEYNEETERFYYVTDMNSDTAVLIYYNNVTAGNPDNMSAYAYHTADDQYYGPLTAKLQLPTTSQWKNVSLTNTTRDIKDEAGTTRVSGFSYSGYAARLLTYEEVNNGCYDGTTAIGTKAGLSSKCKFLMENTKYSNSSMKTYGGWLETSNSSSTWYSWYVYGNYRYVGRGSVNNTSGYGVRPAIEVLKSDISL